MNSNPTTKFPNSKIQLEVGISNRNRSKKKIHILNNYEEVNYYAFLKPILSLFGGSGYKNEHILINIDLLFFFRTFFFNVGLSRVEIIQIQLETVLDSRSI